MTGYKRELRTPPEEACDERGRCLMGNYNGPVPRPDLLRSSAALGRPLPRWLRNLRLKEWQAFQLINREWMLCLAVYDAKLLGTVMILAYHRETKRLYRYEKKVPSRQLHLPCGLGRSRCYYYSRNLSIDILNNLDEGIIELDFNAWNFPGQPALSGSFKAVPIGALPSILHPFAPERPLYSCKGPLRPEGVLEVDGQTSPFAAGDTILLDDHKGYYPRPMRYDWVTTAGVLPSEGGNLALNLTANQIPDPQRFNENGFWREGAYFPLPPVSFQRPEGVMGAWTVRDELGQVDLRFRPEAEAAVLFDWKIVRSDYHGVFGRLSGSLRHPAGGEYELDEWIAMGEQKLILL